MACCRAFGFNLAMRVFFGKKSKAPAKAKKPVRVVSPASSAESMRLQWLEARLRRLEAQSAVIGNRNPYPGYFSERLCNPSVGVSRK